MAKMDWTYAGWRASVPFSNEAVARIYDYLAGTHHPDVSARYELRAAALRRDERLTLEDVRLTRDYLVRTCSICGLAAFYRTGGYEGRCRLHRLIPSAADLHYRRRMEEAAAAATEEDRAWGKYQTGKDNDSRRRRH